MEKEDITDNRKHAGNRLLVYITDSQTMPVLRQGIEASAPGRLG